MPAQSRKILGVDFGRAHDYTAVVLLESRPVETGEFENVLQSGSWFRVAKIEEGYVIRALHRFPLMMDYEAIADGIGDILTGHSDARLVVDATGVGGPVVDMLRRRRLRPVPLVFTGGLEPGYSKQGYFTVPKRELLSRLYLDIGASRLVAAGGLPNWDVLRNEILSIKSDQMGQQSKPTSDWRDAKHDDLVFALAIALWWGYKTRSFAHMEPSKDLDYALWIQWHVNQLAERKAPRTRQETKKAISYFSTKSSQSRRRT